MVIVQASQSRSLSLQHRWERKEYKKSADISIIHSHDFFKGWKLIFIPFFIFSNYAKIDISISEAAGLASGSFEMTNQAAWWVLTKWLKHSIKHSNGTAGLTNDYQSPMHPQMPK